MKIITDKDNHLRYESPQKQKKIKIDLIFNSLIKNGIILEQIKKQFLKKQRQNRYIFKSKKQEFDIIKEKNQFTCSICFEDIVKSCTTTCGHTFCEICIQDSLIFNPYCPICRTYLRNYPFSYSQQLDDLIYKSIQEQSIKTNNQTEKIAYEQRLIDHKKIKQKSKISKFEINQKIDIRDLEYIWCIGTITRIKYSKNKQPKQILIHYDNWDSIFDEFISVDSLRLAYLGTFTNRKNIPNYIRNINPYQNDQFQSYFFNQFGETLSPISFLEIPEILDQQYDNIIQNIRTRNTRPIGQNNLQNQTQILYNIQDLQQQQNSIQQQSQQNSIQQSQPQSQDELLSITLWNPDLSSSEDINLNILR